MLLLRSRRLLLTSALLVVLASSVHSRAATSSSVVGATVLSAAWIDPAGCLQGTANVTDIGPVAAGTSTVTTSDCIVKFGSSNDTSMLRMSQRDGGGHAMRPGASNGVLSYWPLNGSFQDIGSLGNSLVPAGAPNAPTFGSPTASRGDAAIHDATDVMTAPYNAAYDTPVFTVDAWFRTTNNAGVKAIVNKSEPGGCCFGRQFLIEFDNLCACPGPALKGMTTTTTTTYTVRTPAPPLQDGAWHHVAYVVNAEPRQSLYVDGVLVHQQLMAGTVATTVDPVRVGHHYASLVENFVGELDEVRIQNVARTASEVATLAAGNVPDYSDAGGIDWASTGTSFFGACLRDVNDGAFAGATPWTEGPGNTCPLTDGTYWQAIPGASPGTKVAFTTAADAQGGATDPTAHLRFGFRATAAQTAGAYSAPVLFEVVAPNA